MPPEDNKFIDNLYHDLDAELKAAFDEGGAPQLRWQMNNVIACLEFVYMIDRLDRKPTYDEWADRVEELNIGMTRDDLVPFDGG